MENFEIIRNEELLCIEGGGVLGKVGGTLITVGGIIATGVNPVSVVIGGISLVTIWIA